MTDEREARNERPSEEGRGRVQPPGGERGIYEELRPLMFSIAYRMLGSVSEAEDIVQEAFLRYHRAESGADGAGSRVSIDSPKAFLSAVTTRLCIDSLRSARARREAYVGPWLPDPLLTGVAGPAGAGLSPCIQPGGGVTASGIGADPAGLAEQADSLSMA